MPRSTAKWGQVACMSMIVFAAVASPAIAQVPDNLQVSQLVAWCIVPFDAAERGPEQRAAMLADLGITRLAYDWREKHVPTWDAELDALQARKIELTAFWCSSSLEPAKDPGTQRILQFLRRRNVSTQLWIMLPDEQLAQTKSEPERIRLAALAIRQLAEQAQPLGCQVGLYNHGGWVGKPRVLVGIMEQLDDLDNVGVVYNFHHGHHDLDAFPEALRELKPYLLCLNLNGTTVGGPKILPLGAGEQDAELLQWIRQVEYRGPVGILDHRNELDARQSLQENLAGLQRLIERSQATERSRAP